MLFRRSFSVTPKQGAPEGSTDSQMLLVLKNTSSEEGVGDWRWLCRFGDQRVQVDESSVGTEERLWSFSGRPAGYIKQVWTHRQAGLWWQAKVSSTISWEKWWHQISLYLEQETPTKIEAEVFWIYQSLLRSEGCQNQRGPPWKYRLMWRKDQNCLLVETWKCVRYLWQCKSYMQGVLQYINMDQCIKSFSNDMMHRCHI